jgi:hypothetical protein
MPQRKFFAAAENLVFDFEFFIGGRCEVDAAKKEGPEAFRASFMGFRCGKPATHNGPALITSFNS